MDFLVPSIHAAVTMSLTMFTNVFEVECLEKFANESAIDTRDSSVVGD